jgi:hypothetical protein
MRLPLTLLLFVDVLIATGVFISLARPDVVIAFCLRTFGMGGDWFQEHVSEEELVRLRHVMRLVSLAGLALIFSASFGLGLSLAMIG